jgi:hypothetical protein
MRPQSTHQPHIGLGGARTLLQALRLARERTGHFWCADGVTSRCPPKLQTDPLNQSRLMDEHSRCQQTYELHTIVQHGNANTH